MAHIEVIHVTVRTAAVPQSAATDDTLYVGVEGTDGGREFPLNVAGFDGFEPGTQIRYLLGREEDAVGSLPPVDFTVDKSEKPDQRNHPSYYRIELHDVTGVYLRKQGDLSHAGDDAYQLDQIEVQLHSPNTNQIRTFRNTHNVGNFGGDDIFLGNEYGHQVWLRE
ncbi:MAG TPA: hypothetical protein VFZ70_04330 [Euzebyales bacterium]